MTTKIKPSSRNNEPSLKKEIAALKARLRELNSENLRLQKKIASLEAKQSPEAVKEEILNRISTTSD